MLLSISALGAKTSLQEAWKPRPEVEMTHLEVKQQRPETLLEKIHMTNPPDKM